MQTFHGSTVYQIYIKSFCDSDGDGIGDLNGIRMKLPYVKSLGVDYIWITPFFPSPMNDNGYDISDYCAVNPLFGTMEDCEALIKEARELGIGLMFDMVFNHTSTSHRWFQKALAGDPEYMEYYIFRDPVDGHAPTNWDSKFGGNAWEFVPSLGKYYLHLFDVTQADLNWENPRVREELKNVIRFWKEKGISGFRFDVVNLISKPPVFEDDFEGDGRRMYTDGPRIHEFLKELVADTGIGEMVTVGEMSSTSLDSCIRYTKPSEKELKMAFSFHHLKVDYAGGDKWALKEPDLKQLGAIFRTWQEGMSEGGGWNAVFWCNHDQPRSVSRFGDDRAYRRESAKMLALLIHMMRGTPYIYQGDELGMTDPGYTSISQYRDVESLNYYRILLERGAGEDEAFKVISRRSRDNGRTPMQWDASETAGFTSGTPWIGIPENHTYINAAAEEEDPDSVLSFYRALTALRKEKKVIQEGSIRFLETGTEKVIAYERVLGSEKLTVVCSLTGEEVPVSSAFRKGTCLISNYPEESKVKEGRPEESSADRTLLRPYEAAAYLA